jgi:hypothetical protein
LAVANIEKTRKAVSPCHPGVVSGR